MRTVIWFGIVTAADLAIRISGVDVPADTIQAYSNVAGAVALLAIFIDVWMALHDRD